MSSSNISDLLTSFSPSSDFFAISSGDGRIKTWDTRKGQLQTEFADIATTDELGIRSESERGHLSLDYKCMKWVQVESKKKKKSGSSVLVLGTGNGDVLALDVALGQLKWRVNDCHPGGVTAVSYSTHNLCIYTAGVDGMICQIDLSAGRILGKFKASRKVISALSISADGKLLATASAQLKIFNCSNNKKIQKFSGHTMAVRCMFINEDGNYILSSAAGEKSVAIWKIDGGKKQSASCVLYMEHPAVVLDSKGSSCTEGSKGSGLYVLAVSEVGLCYFWYGSSIEAMQASKPTKISLSIDSSLPRNNKGLAIFSARFHHIISPSSSKMLVAYGTLVKPSFEKITVEYGKDVNLNVSQDGVLLPFGQPNISHKSQETKTKVTVLDRANAEDAILPLPKLYAHEKKRKHGMPPLITEAKKVVDPVVSSMSKTLLCPEVIPQKMEEGNLTSIEGHLRAAGILGAKDNHVLKRDPRNPLDIAISAAMANGAHFSIDVNMPTKKIRSHILSMSPNDAYKMLERLSLSWRTRSATSNSAFPWIYHILVIHGEFIVSQESGKQLLDGLHKMTKLRCGALQPLLNLSGSLQLIMAQIDKARQSMVPTPPVGSHNDKSDEEEEDEDVDELIYGEEDDESQSGSGDDK